MPKNGEKRKPSNGIHLSDGGYTVTSHLALCHHASPHAINCVPQPRILPQVARVIHLVTEIRNVVNTKKYCRSMLFLPTFFFLSL